MSNYHRAIAKSLVALLAMLALANYARAFDVAETRVELDSFEQYVPDKPELLPRVEPKALAVAFGIEQTAAESVPAEPLTLADMDPLQRPIFSLTADGEAPIELVLQLGKLPEDFAINDLSQERFGSWNEPEEPRLSKLPRFTGTLYTWAAPAVFHRPLLFEQPNLERYGHHCRIYQRDNLTQSAISAAHFFATVPIVPYKVGATGGLCGWGSDDCARNYVLGSYRPGSCNHHQLIKPRWSWCGLAYQGAATTGLVFLLP